MRRTTILARAWLGAGTTGGIFAALVIGLTALASLGGETLFLGGAGFDACFGLAGGGEGLEGRGDALAVGVEGLEAGLGCGGAGLGCRGAGLGCEGAGLG